MIQSGLCGCKYVCGSVSAGQNWVAPVWVYECHTIEDPNTFRPEVHITFSQDFCQESLPTSFFV